MVGKRNDDGVQIIFLMGAEAADVASAGALACPIESYKVHAFG
jgi:hypothetical protein